MDHVNKMSNDRQTILTDVHVHLQDKRFSADLDPIFERARQNGIERFLCSATGPGDWFALQKLGRRYDNVLMTYGVHPWFTKGISGDWEDWLRILLDEKTSFNFPWNDFSGKPDPEKSETEKSAAEKFGFKKSDSEKSGFKKSDSERSDAEKSGFEKIDSKKAGTKKSDSEESGAEKISAEKSGSGAKGDLASKPNNDQEFRPGIGEIGLDFALRDKDIDEQEDFFRKQLAIAHEMRIPVVLHTVHAVDRTLEILAEYPDIALMLFHGFVGTANQIEKITDLGGFFSFSQRNVQPQNVKSLETIRAVPRDRILLESDGPTLVPRNSQPGKIAPPIALQQRSEEGYLRDEPAQIPLTLKEMARIRNIDPEELTRQIMINEKRFFRNWPRYS